MKNLPVLLAFLFIPFFSIAQHCGTPEIEAEKEKKYPGYKKSQEYLNKLITAITEQKNASRITGEEQIYQIPVVVHVIHNTSSGRIGGLKNPNISETQIISQIDVLNEDFRRKENSNGFNTHPLGADTKIEFCLASRDPDGNPTTGIVRKFYNKSSWKQSTDEVLLKSLSYWPADQYLNIWVADLGDLDNGALLGYSHFPADADIYIQGIDRGAVAEELDGVVIDYENFGSKLTGLRRNYDLGRTATHEVGHFFGLYHIWGDQECGDDYVTDTPVDKEQNNTGTCSDSSNCKNPSVFTKDLTNNYLDYSYDKCMNLFTTGQKNRMRAVIENVPRRKALINSPGCCGGSQLETGPFTQTFENSGAFEKQWFIHNPGLTAYSPATPGAYASSEFSFRFTPSGIFSGDTATNKNYGYLISPYVYFQNTENPYFSFDLAYASADQSGKTDSIVISYQVNCGKWVPLKVLTASDLTSTTRIQKGFSPDTQEWKTYSFDIPQLKNKSVGRFRIEYYSKGINNLYIDNLNIFETTEKITLTPYPNPTRDLLNLKLSYEGEKELVMKVYSSLGALVSQRSFSRGPSFTHPLDFSSFNQGIYYIQVISGNEIALTRVLKLR